MKRSFRDPVTNVLKAWGYVSANEAGDIGQVEDDSFSLAPGVWQWNGSAWAAYVQPPTPDPHATVKQKIDAVSASAGIPQPVKDFVAALRTIL